jgi:putative PEP-CTERM system histidine kinase
VRALSAAVARRVAETLNVPSASVWLLEDGGGFALGGSTVHSAADGETLARDPQALRAILAGLGPRRDPARLPAPPEALAPGDPRAELRSAVALCAGGDTVGLLTLSDRPDGQPLTAEDLDLLKTLADQAAASLLGLRLAERLVRAREMEAFQAVSAFFVHDLKNLASKLSLTLQNLPARYDDPAFRADLLGVISRSVGKINDMCSRLSPLGRRLEMRGAASDLNEVVLGALAGLNGALRGTLVQDLHPVPSAVIDAEQMQKVLLNLVLNASEATEGGGEIRVSTGERDGWVCLAVADDGVGMSAEAVGSLFQPFKTTKPQGLGIGLYHAREIVAAHRGRIEVESAPGRGSTFRVLLPAARDRGEANR